MIRLIAHPLHPAGEVIERAAESVQRGGVAAFPTETLYGIGGMYAFEAAADRVRAMKRLEPAAPLLLLAPDRDWVLRLSSPSGALARSRATALMDRFWPGPLTLVLPASPRAPGWLVSAAGGIALRVPGPSAAAALTAAAGAPIVATSANRHGEPPAVSGAEVLNSFGAELDLLLDGGALRGENPSTLVDLTGPRSRILRAGAVGAGELAPWIDPPDRNHKDVMTPSAGKESPEERAGGRAAGIRSQVLFVCSGNTCRSPLAAAILRDLLPAALREAVEVVSAGTGALPGAPASMGSLQVAAANGLALGEHRSRRLTRDLVQESDLIIAMEAAHRDAVRALDPAARERTHLLKGLAAGLPPGEGAGVIDPMGGTDDAYERTFRELRDAIRAALPAIESAVKDAS